MKSAVFAIAPTMQNLHNIIIRDLYAVESKSSCSNLAMYDRQSTTNQPSVSLSLARFLCAGYLDRKARGLALALS